MKSIGSSLRRLIPGVRFLALRLPMAAGVAVLLSVPAPSQAAAQSLNAGDGTVDRIETRQQSAKRDFLFRAPRVRIQLRTGYNVARAGGDVFDFTRENLTVDRHDFGAFAIGGDVSLYVTPRFDLVLGFLHAGTSVRSEFRDYYEEALDGSELPIEQRTRFSQTPLTAGFRYYLVERGRQIGRFVWIPTRVVPYIGASVGAVYYRFEQEGDWVLDVNADESGIEYGRLESTGWTPTAQLMGGLELGLTPWMALVTEGRVSYANAEPGYDFVGFDGIDLSGLQVTVGLSFRM